MAIKSDGSLWVWGSNYSGQFGTGNNDNSYTPIQVGIDKDWALIAAGYDYSLAIKSDGSLWAWGQNYYGQLGTGNNTSSTIPIFIGNGFERISASIAHTLAIKTDGTLWACGWNLYGQLGDGTNNNSDVLVQIGSASDRQEIDAGYDFSFAMSSNGDAFSFGRNGHGQLGDGTMTNSNTQISVSCSILPISLLSFKGRSNGNENFLYWSTASEVNNKAFEVERSENGFDFVKIGTILGAGNSQAVIDYKLIDRNQSSIINYYRLKQIDFDGMFTYSDVISIFSKGDKTLTIGPNPATNQVFINGDFEPISFRLINNIGIKLVEGIVKKNEAIDISFLPSGVYYLDIGESHKRFLKI